MLLETQNKEAHASKNLKTNEYLSLNSELNFYGPDGKIQFEKDKEATRSYFLDHVNRNTVFFHTLSEKLDYLIKEEYYEAEFLAKYKPAFIKRLYQRAYAKKFRFQSFVGAYKYYTSYTLKTFDGKRYLERFEDRVAAVALHIANGDEAEATDLLDEMMAGRYQPATPTFLNAGKKQRGEFVSCFLISIEDDLNSIGRAINSALQLSKRGGGVALSLTDIRAEGDPIKKIENQSSGIIPVMKLLEDSFSYANQLGARQGAGAVYLHAHHMDVLTFLRSKKENADEKIRIKTLSLGLVIPDITYELAANDESMYLFSPYDVMNEYGKPFSEVDVTAEYHNMVNNGNIRKKKINAREFLQDVADVQFQSGYPYIMFADNVNRQNPIKGTIKMSNLCSEILQVQEPSIVKADQTYEVLGKDISCNLGSMNIALALESPDFGKTVEVAIRALTAVSDISNIDAVPTIDSGNKRSHAVGLGAMNLHGALAEHGIMYGSPDALDFTNMYFYSVAYYAIKASNAIAKERGETFDGFKDSTYASGAFFDKYVDQVWEPKSAPTKKAFANVHIPTQADWAQLREDVMAYGLYNQNLQAVPPTGSISYINNSSASILPITSMIEIRKEGKIGRLYYPAPHMTNDNLHLFKDAYEIGNKAIIDTYAIAQQHVDQGMSLTLFFKETATTRDLNKAQIYAHRKGIKTLYYVRLRTIALEGTENSAECVSCQV
jgi:ribonucleoside-diphosphate reductase alpha chain